MIRKYLILAFIQFCSITLIAQSWCKDLEKAAKKGDVTSQYAVANAYYFGDGVNVDKAKAAKWYYKATLNNNTDAKEKLYSFYSKELEKYAKSGNAQAQYEIGLDYFEGTGVIKNTEIAAKWLLLATIQGHINAKEKFNSFYSKVLEKYAKNGDVQALYSIGCFYFDGKGGIGQDEKKGFEFLKKAHEKGHPDALNKMGTRYSKSLRKISLNWLDEIKNNDYAYALALCYLNGNGVEKNKTAAISILAQLADRGHEKGYELFYNTESKRRKSREIEYFDKKHFEILGYKNTNIVIINNKLNGKSTRTTSQQLTQKEITDITNYNPKLSEMTPNFFSLKNIEITIGTRNKNKVIVKYIGDIYIKHPEYEIDYNGNQKQISNSLLLYSPTGCFEITGLDTSLPSVKLPLNKVVGFNDKEKLVLSETFTPVSITAIANTEIPKINNAKVTRMVELINDFDPYGDNDILLENKYIYEFGQNIISVAYSSYYGKLNIENCHFVGNDKSTFTYPAIDNNSFNKNNNIKIVFPNGKQFTSPCLLTKNGITTQVNSGTLGIEYVKNLINMGVNIDANLGETLIKKAPEGTLIVNGKETRYKNGITLEAYEKEQARLKQIERQKREAEEAKREKEQQDNFLKEVEAKYGKKQANLLRRNWRGGTKRMVFTNGLDITLVEDIIGWTSTTYLYRDASWSDGTSIYYWKSYGEYIGKFWTRKGVVYDWLEY